MRSKRDAIQGYETEGTCVMHGDYRVPMFDWRGLDELDLEEALLRRIHTHLEEMKDTTKANDALDQVLTVGQRMLLKTFHFEGLVDDSGFQLFFTEGTCRWWRMILDMLELIGAREQARLLRLALRVFPESTPHADVDARREFVGSLGQKDMDALGRLDSRFYRSNRGENSLRKLRRKYIESHIDEFMLPVRLVKGRGAKR